MTTEKDIERMHIIELQSIDCTLFKNNVGTAEKTDPRTGKKSFVRFGLCRGSSDLIGIVPKVITPDMVGKTVGIFTAIEIKKDVRKSYQKQRMEEQQRFIDFVNSKGGIAFKSDDPSLAIEKVKKALDFKETKT